MTADQFVTILRQRRNYLETRLRRCNSLFEKETLLYKVEKLNIFIQEFGEVDAYHLSYKKERRNKF